MNHYNDSHADQDKDMTCIEGVFQTVVEGHSAYYVSTPITSGTRFVKWRSSSGLTEVDATYVDEHRRHVIDANRAEVRPFVQALRRRYSVPVIDPTALDDVPGWTQADYRTFWGRVIERYADTVIFMHGWEYSSGCSYEFIVAKKAAVNTVDSEMNVISVADGHAKLTEAVTAYHQVGIPVTFLESVEQMLLTLSDGKG